MLRGIEWGVPRHVRGLGYKDASIMLVHRRQLDAQDRASRIAVDVRNEIDRSACVLDQFRGSAIGAEIMAFQDGRMPEGFAASAWSDLPVPIVTWEIAIALRFRQSVQGCAIP
jgi:hypothetical protein